MTNRASLLVRSHAKRITAIFSKYPIQDVVRYLKPSHPSRTQCVCTIKLKENALHLKEIVVVAPLKAMEQKGDTTIYNVDAYPTPEGSYLQELVKRIPGLTYDPKEKPSLTTDIPSKK